MIKKQRKVGMLVIGILNVYKPQGKTSHDVVSFVRRQLKMKRVGHTGTLDPMATGVLPILVGHATKLSDIIMADEKKYKARVMLGITTDTDDISGEIIKKTPVSVTREMIEETTRQFIGTIEQIPPMYSAIKVDGKKLYQLARRGIEIERKPRKVTIYSISISNFNGAGFDMDVHCSKGTYIRALCRDIGIKLGTGATMTELERTMSGVFTKENSHTLEEIEALSKNEQIKTILIAPDSVLSDIPKILADDKMCVKIKNGIRLRPNQLGIAEFKENDLFRIYKKNELVCLLRVKDCGGELLLAMEKSFY